MFVSIQVTASLGRPIVQWSILEVNKDSMTFADLFQAIKAGRFEVISMSDELKKTKLSKTFVGTKTDGLMATSSSQTLRVCSQFGNYIRFSVDLEEEDSVGLHAATLPNAFVIMAASQRRLQLGDTGLPFAAEVKDGRDRMYNDLLGLMREMGVKWSDPRVFGATFLKNLRDVLWYIDDHHDTIAAQVPAVPKVFAKFNGYNCPGSHHFEVKGEHIRNHNRKSLRRVYDYQLSW